MGLLDSLKQQAINALKTNGNRIGKEIGDNVKNAVKNAANKSVTIDFDEADIHFKLENGVWKKKTSYVDWVVLSDEYSSYSLNDKTVDVPNGDGKYFFDTNYKEKSFSINFAFDSLTERNLQELKTWLNGKTIEPLVFDETPYKMYMAKVTGTSTIKYVCFNRKDG